MKQILSEEFLRMQKLAGVITESQYKEKVKEVEMGTHYGDPVANASSAFGELKSKLKSKIENSSVFKKLIDKIVSNMSEKDIANFKSAFNLAEAEGGPSFDDIFNKVNAANPDKNVKNPEELKEELDRDTLIGKIVNLIRNLTGINLVAFGGLPLGLFINYLLKVGPLAEYMGPSISLIVSWIIHGISRKLLGMGDDVPIVGD